MAELTKSSFNFSKFNSNQLFVYLQKCGKRALKLVTHISLVSIWFPVKYIQKMMYFHESSHVFQSSFVYRIHFQKKHIYCCERDDSSIRTHHVNTFHIWGFEQLCEDTSTLGNDKVHSRVPKLSTQNLNTFYIIFDNDHANRTPLGVGHVKMANDLRRCQSELVSMKECWINWPAPNESITIKLQNR